MYKWFASIVIATGMILLAGSGANAQGPVTITVTQIDQSRFPQIDLYVSATDANGNPVRDLPSDSFQVLQNGTSVGGLQATRAGGLGSVNVVLAIDRSGSMALGGKMVGAKQAATTFVNLMRPGDRTALIQFDSEIDTLEPLTDDKAALNASIQKIVPRGNTAFYDALAQAGKFFETATGRKAVIVVTDGMDNISKTNRETAIEQATRGGYSVSTIGLGDRSAGYGNHEGIDESVLREFANASMGSYFYAPDASQLSALYQRLSVLMQNEYKLSYVSPDPLRNGLRRDIVVTTAAKATARAVYNPGGVIPEVAPGLESWVLFLLALALLIALFFAPAALRLVTARLASSPPKAAVKITGSVRTRTTATPSAKAPRIKIRKETPSGSNLARRQLPWDEPQPKK